MNVRDYNQDQGILFPPHLREFLPDVHQAVVINDVVETLDLSCLYQKVSPEGNPAYHPKMMLKILIYGYANGIFSSRRLQKALGESIAFIYLAAWQKPDFRTISDFRKNNLAELQDLFGQVVDMCTRLGMVSLGHIAIDGSKFKANASDKRTYDKKRISKAIDKLLKQADKEDSREDRLFGSGSGGDEIPVEIQRQADRLEKLETIKRQLDESGREKINATDPDAVFMKTRQGITTSYNGQTAVDESCHVIVAADVTNDPSDNEQLVPMVEQIEETIGAFDTLSADSGYSSGENLKELVEKNIDAYIPDANYQGNQRGKQEAPGGPYFPRSKFVRDEAQDCFICPAGEKLTFSHMQKVKNKQPLRMYRCRVSKHCPLRDQCTRNKGGRTITLNPYDDQLRAMRSKLDTQYGKRMYAKRKTIVEPVFGHIKETIGFCKFSLRGLQKVCGEFLLVCIAHNVRKIVNALKPQSTLCEAAS
jgi:transposase